jgi:hypothetical protein
MLQQIPVEMSGGGRRIGARFITKGDIMADYAVLMFAPTDADGNEADIGTSDLYDRYAQGMVDRGEMFAAFQLESVDAATSIRGDVISDGPFLEAKEVIVGFYLIDAPDLDAALRIARINPITQYGGGVEVRPVGATMITPRTE